MFPKSEPPTRPQRIVNVFDGRCATGERNVMKDAATKDEIDLCGRLVFGKGFESDLRRTIVSARVLNGFLRYVDSD